MRRRIAIIVTTAALACGNPVDPGPMEPDPGFVAASIVSTNQGVGAIWMTLSGAVIDSVRATGFTLFVTAASPREATAIVMGPIANGEILQFWVTDRNELAAYQVVINEAAAAATYQQLVPTGFTVTLSSVGN